MTSWPAEERADGTPPRVRGPTLFRCGYHADRGEVGTGDGRRLFEERADRLLRRQVDRVRLDEPGLQRPGVQARGLRPPAVGHLDPTSMGRAQPVEAVPERMDDLGNPRSRFEPRAHRADESDAGGIGELTSPSPLVLDHRAPERDRSDDGRRGPGGAGSFEHVEAPAGVDAAAASDIGRRVFPDMRGQDPPKPRTGLPPPVVVATSRHPTPQAPGAGLPLPRRGSRHATPRSAPRDAGAIRGRPCP